MGKLVNEFSSPAEINTERKKMIQEVVLPRYVVKHLLNLFFILHRNKTSNDLRIMILDFRLKLRFYDLRLQNGVTIIDLRLFQTSIEDRQSYNSIVNR